MLRSADAVFERAGERSTRSSVLAALSRELLAQGRLDQADQAALLALEMGSTDDVVNVVEVLGVQAQLLAACGRPADAVALAHRAIELLGDTDMCLLIGDAWDAYGRVLLVAGRRPEATDALSRAISAYEQKGAVALVAAVERRRTGAGV